VATIKSIVQRDGRTGALVVDYKVGAPLRGDRSVSSVPSVVQNPVPHRVGLGDLVARFAQPIAAVVDALTDRFLTAEHKTELAKCSACARRHRKLNLLCPDVLTCPVLGHLLDLLPGPARKALLAAAEKHAKR
jgi:hypothetical protein